MKKLTKYGALAGFAVSLAPLAARAADDVTDMNATDMGNMATTTTATATSTAAAGALFGGLLIFWLIAMVIGIALFIFWIIMLIDALKRTNWKQESDKNLWLILLIVGIFVGLAPLAAIVYYFVVKRPLDAGKKPVKK